MTTDFYKDADTHLSEDFNDLFKTLRDLVGKPNVPLIIQESDEHGAATDMKKVFMGTNYVAWTMPENYHKFPDAFIAAGVAFTIGHELGHITVHPGQGSDWMKEIRELPIDAHEQGQWSNIISDIMVNYMVSRGANMRMQSTESKKMIKKLDFGHRADTLFRVSYAGTLYGEPDTKGIDKAALLIQRNNPVNAFGKPMKDNRYTPDPSTGLSQGDFYPHAAGDKQAPSDDPANPTPLYQRLMGYGRGPQIYPPIQYCVSNNDASGKPYDKNYKLVNLLKDKVEVQYSSKVDSYQVYQTRNGTCEITGDSTSSYATFNQKNAAGKLKQYEVVETRTFDGRTNPTQIEPIELYKITDGGAAKWIPSRYCCPVCPDTGLPCSPNWNRHFGYKPPSFLKSQPGTQKYTFSTRMMLSLEWAIIMATRPEGYGGTTGRDAATKFLKDLGYTLHAAAMEAGGNF